MSLVLKIAFGIILAYIVINYFSAFTGLLIIFLVIGAIAWFLNEMQEEMDKIKKIRNDNEMNLNDDKQQD